MEVYHGAHREVYHRVYNWVYSGVYLREKESLRRVLPSSLRRERILCAEFSLSLSGC